MPHRSRFLAIAFLISVSAGANAATTRQHAAPSKPAARAQAGKPMFGVTGFDDAGMDKATRPGNDFFRFANGTWIDRTPIPPDLPAYSLRRAMTDRIEQRLHGIMEGAAAHAPRAPKTLEGKVGAFYSSFMDEA